MRSLIIAAALFAIPAASASAADIQRIKHTPSINTWHIIECFEGGQRVAQYRAQNIELYYGSDRLVALDFDDYSPAGADHRRHFTTSINTICDIRMAP